MTVEEKITVLEAKAEDTAGRFISAASDPDERQRLIAEYREQLDEINGLKEASK